MNISDRRKFIKTSALAGMGILAAGKTSIIANNLLPAFESKRPPLAKRNFVSDSVEKTIAKVKASITNPELGWLFENCFPNTLDTTVDFEIIDGKPDTYVITGDIDAMWLRDSTAQIWPYLPLIKEDAKLKELVKGVINRQTKCILLDPYANAFYKDFSKESEWKHDLTKMKPGIHERKWEIDSLCYPIRLAHGYWKLTGDTSMFDSKWKEAMLLVLKTFREQQRFQDKGPYSFQRETAWATDGVPLSGYGYPVKPCGLIVSTFRPSDDCTLFPYLIPSNMFAIEVLGYLAEMFSTPVLKDEALVAKAKEIQQQVKQGLKENGIFVHPKFGEIIAFEVNGFGSFNLMDDANVPSLLSLPYLKYVSLEDEVYKNTRRFVLSDTDPFFFKIKMQFVLFLQLASELLKS